MSALLFLAGMVFMAWQWVFMVAFTADLFRQAGVKAERTAAVTRRFGRFHQELWLFAPPGLLIGTVEHFHTPGLQWLVVIDAIWLFNWWHYRNWPDENRWKRRAKKAKDAVTVRAGRLVVVPAGSAS